jgi:uncharacterized protein YndB with AHSA1/START domain
MTATLHTTDGRPMLRFERRLRHPVSRVWRAVTDPAELAGWFPFLVEVDQRPGGAMTFTEPKGLVEPSSGTVTAWDPPSVFAFRWRTDELRFELSADGDGTLLVFTQVFDERAAAATFAAGWELCLAALESGVDGADGAERAPGDWAVWNARYVEEFGLLDGEVRATPDGRELRFEQVLVRPREAVWAALAGPEPSVGAELPDGSVPGAPATVTELDPPGALAAATPDGSGVRWELTPRDFGMRLVVTHTLPAGDGVDDLRAAWRKRLAALAET